MIHATAPIPVLPFTSSLLSCTEQSFGAAPMDTAGIHHRRHAATQKTGAMNSGMRWSSNAVTAGGVPNQDIFPNVSELKDDMKWMNEKIKWHEGEEGIEKLRVLVGWNWRNGRTDHHNIIPLMLPRLEYGTPVRTDEWYNHFYIGRTYCFTYCISFYFRYYL